MASLVRRSSVGLATLVAFLALVGCGSTSPGGSAPPVPADTESDPAPATFTVTGSVTVAGASYADSAVKGESCTTTADAEPIAGLQLVLSDDAGATLALANLPEQGTFTESSASDGWFALCAFGFRFEDVPDGLSFYTVSAGDLGELKYGRDDLNGPIELAVG